MNELKPCPICGKQLTVYGPEDWTPTIYDPGSGGDPYNAVCDCGFQFSIGDCEYSEFVEAINRRAEPENKPLTLEQLKQMDGEPVWIEDEIGKGWFLIGGFDGKFLHLYEMSIQVKEPISAYGKTWFAYAYKPIAQENTKE